MFLKLDLQVLSGNEVDLGLSFSDMEAEAEADLVDLETPLLVVRGQ